MGVAVVSEVAGHDPSDVARVAAALQRQVSRDFQPIWGVEATVGAFPRLEDVPNGYYPMIVGDDFDVAGAAGFHLDHEGQPFVLLVMSDSWSLAASHELLDLLANPSGNQLVASPSPRADQNGVELLVDVCGPCQAAEHGYTVNHTLVSDFATPQFFDQVRAPGVRYSFTAAIMEPRTILRGGCISWHDPASDHWWQQVWFGSAPKFRDLGVSPREVASLKIWY